MSATLSAGAVAASFAFAPPRFAIALAVGAALEAINLRAMLGAANRLFGGELAGGGAWVGGFSARFGAMAVGVVAALHFGLDAAGLLVGLSLAMPAVVFWAWRNRPEVLEHEVLEALAPDDPSWDRWSVWRAKEVEPASDEVPPNGEHGA